MKHEKGGNHSEAKFSLRETRNRSEPFPDHFDANQKPF
jgi:hypothetical protein